MSKKLFYIFSYLTVALLLGMAVSYAGTLTPPGSPSKTMKSLSDLYELINTGSNTPATDFTTPGTVSATMHSLGDTYDLLKTKITAIDATKILTGTTIFGVGGSAVAGADLSNMWNGTRGSFVGGSQLNGGVDDVNNGDAPPSGRYSATWTQCTAGNTYCGTGDSGAAYKDESTGLVWSKTLNMSTYALDDSDGYPSWYQANNCTETGFPWTCTKKTSDKTGCEANTGWYMPSQKQLLMAYIDGAYGNLEEVANAYFGYYSSTTVSNFQSDAYTVDISSGYTKGYRKDGSGYVRCVR